jgi:Ca-activated chloride channel family protein
MNGPIINRRLMFVLAGLLAPVTGALCTQPTPRPTLDVNTLSVDVNLVLVPVVVTDRSGASVEGLQQDNFKIYQDNTPQGIVAFSQEDQPVAVAVVVDVSGSMTGRLSTAKAAARRLIDVLDPEDEVFLINFADSARLSAGPSGGHAHARDQLVGMRAGGSTAFFDAIHLGITQLKQADLKRRALVVISDGLDNHSRFSETELVKAALEADVQLYTMGIWDLPPGAKALEAQELRQGLFLLEKMANVTGGRYWQLHTTQQAADAAEAVNVAIHNQYVLAYQPPACDQSGKWHRIKVQLDQPHLRARARAGYYSPAR